MNIVLDPMCDLRPVVLADLTPGYSTTDTIEKLFS